MNPRDTLWSYEWLEASISFLPIFGCRCFIKNNRDQFTKFQPKSDEVIFLGYSSKSKAYWVFKHLTRVIEKGFDITFDDNFIQNSKPSHVTTHIMESDVTPPGSPNRQVIYEVDFESLLGLVETTLNYESK